MKSFKSISIIFYVAILGFSVLLPARAQYNAGGQSFGWATPTMSFDSANSDLGQGIYAFDLNGVYANVFLNPQYPILYGASLSLNYATGQPWDLVLSASPGNLWGGSVVGDQLQLNLYQGPNVNNEDGYQGSIGGVFYFNGPPDINATISYSGTGSWWQPYGGENGLPIYEWPTKYVSYTMTGTVTVVPEPKSEGLLAGSLSLIAVIALTTFSKNKSAFKG
jgi:hypothetical protein